MSKRFRGSAAIEEVIRREGALTAAQERIVRDEGFVDGVYKDDKGITTSGVGQTGPFRGKSFKETYEIKEKEARRLVPSYHRLPEQVQSALVTLAYRGDLQQSPKFRALMAQGRYKEASVELLNHKEYKDRLSRGGDGVTKRLEQAANDIEEYAHSRESMVEWAERMLSNFWRG